MRLPRLSVLMVALGSMLHGGTAHAQSSQPPGWEFSLTPYAWLPAMRGNLQTPLPRVGDRSLSIGAGTVVTDLDALPAMLAGEARYGRFSILGDFFYAALAQDLSTRDLLWQGGHSRVTSTVGTLLGMVRVLEAPRQSVDIGAGTRIWGFTTKVSLNPGLEPGVIRKASLNWADPLVAARYHARLSPRFGVTAYGDIGGFDTGSRLTWQVVGSLDYDLTDWAILRAGWRSLNVDKRNTTGSVGIDLGFNGPFFGATFRF
jgi:hypothetical protein